MDYSLFNAALSLPILTSVAFLLRTRREFAKALRVALGIAIISYPWIYFLISLGAWDYSQPGPRLFRVPINDLIFTFLCTLLSGSLFVRLGSRRRS